MNKAAELSSWKSALLTLLFAGIALFGILHHEIWLDEAHHWLLARDSHSWKELIYNCRYEGHPMLWNFLLYFLSSFTSNPLAMQILNLVIISTGVFIFLRYGPFYALQKIFFICSYFILFEYSVIARNYGLVFLALTLVALAYEKRGSKFLQFTFLLILLSQTHFIAAILATGIFVLTSYEFKTQNYFPPKYYTGLALFIISLVLVFWQSIPPKDHFIYTFNSDGFLSLKRIAKGMTGMWKGLVPIPDFTTELPWNSNLLINNSRLTGAIPAVIGWVIPFFILGRDKKMILFFYVCAAAIATFLYLSPLVLSVRYCGFYFLLLIFCLWISEKRMKYKLSRQLLYFILVCQLSGTLFLFYTDSKRPFSNGKAVAEWLKTNADPKITIMVSDHFSGPSISAYLGKKLFYPENNAPESFCLWNTKPFILTQEELLVKVWSQLKKTPADHLWLVSDKELKDFPFEKYPGIEKFDKALVTQFPGAMVMTENYWIYKIKKGWEYRHAIY